MLHVNYILIKIEKQKQKTLQFHLIWCLPKLNDQGVLFFALFLISCNISIPQNIPPNSLYETVPCELSFSPICTENTQYGHLRSPKTLTRNIKESLALFLPPLKVMVPTQYYHSEVSARFPTLHW